MKKIANDKMKVITEKMISFSPLYFKDAVEVLLKVKLGEGADIKYEYKKEGKS